MLLEGKVALVTGGSRGIGAAISKNLARDGAIVAAGCTSADKAATFQAKVEAEGLPIHLVEGNVGDPDDCQRVVDQVIAEHGRLDILVNNAGITVDKTVKRMSIDDWHAVLRVNLSGSFYMCKAALEHLVDSGKGRIVNISSVVGATGNPGQGNYAASKAGMVGMSKSLAYEVASRGITVNCVAPGFITTAMTDKLTDDQKAGILGQIPAGRMGAADEIAAAALYLASPQAGYVTGTTLHVNGGMAML